MERESCRPQAARRLCALIFVGGGLNEESIVIAYREDKEVKTMRGVFVEGRLTLEGKSYSREI